MEYTSVSGMALLLSELHALVTSMDPTTALRLERNLSRSGWTIAPTPCRKALQAILKAVERIDLVERTMCRTLEEQLAHGNGACTSFVLSLTTSLCVFWVRSRAPNCAKLTSFKPSKLGQKLQSQIGAGNVRWSLNPWREVACDLRINERGRSLSRTLFGCLSVQYQDQSPIRCFDKNCRHVRLIFQQPIGPLAPRELLGVSRVLEASTWENRSVT